ncbi:uncharacterized protein LOC109399007 [Aedes albopictus]|uniref:Doublesex dimerisation domain-containing protein n=1 Tax=Aedes albopictus TaxID=7160 RepID=A0ABM1XNG0_AEDAL
MRDALALKTKRNSYADVLRAMSGENRLSELGADVKSIRRTRTGEMMLVFKKDAITKGSSYTALTQEVLGKKVQPVLRNGFPAGGATDDTELTLFSATGNQIPSPVQRWWSRQSVPSSFFFAFHYRVVTATFTLIGLECKPPLCVHRRLCFVTSNHSSGSPEPGLMAQGPPPPHHMRVQHLGPDSRTDDELVRQSQQLLEKLHYPWEMMPLMYVILKGANGDVAKAHQRIDEAHDLCVLYHPDRFPKERPAESKMKMIVTLTPCSSFPVRSRSRSPDNNGGALNLDIKSTRAMTSTTEDDDVAGERSSPKVSESSELQSRLQEAFHNQIVAESVVASGSGFPWRRKRYDSSETGDIEIEHDSEEPPPHSIQRHTRKDDMPMVAVPAAAAPAPTAEEQPMPVPKSNGQMSFLKNGPAITAVDPVALLNFRYPYPYWFPTHSLFHQFAHPPPRGFCEDAASFQKDIPSDLSRVDPSHSHQSSAAVASIH